MSFYIRIGPRYSPSVLTLFLMRHAKSSWSDPGLTDHDRPLNSRGIAAAPQMGSWLRSKGTRFDAVLASTATRALQTARRVAEASGFSGKIELSRRLYLASPEEIADVISDVAEGARSLLVVAHNPGMQELVSHWAKQVEHFPTAAVAEFELPLDDWAEVSIHAGARFRGIWRPKELPR